MNSTAPFPERRCTGARALRHATPLVLSILIFSTPSVTTATETKRATAPSQGAAEILVRPLWEVGGPDDDLLIGRVAEVVVDDDGTVYALDGQLAQVQVIDADGQWLRSIGREGEGPGEFREPRDLFLTPDGRVAVVQTVPAKIALLAPDGTTLDDHPLPDPNTGVRFLTSAWPYEGGVVLTSSAFLTQDDGTMQETTLLYAIDDAGEEVAEFHRTGSGMDFANFTVDETALDNVANRWTATTDGRVFFAPEFEEYRIEVYSITGEHLQTLVRDVAPRPRTAAEKQVVRDNYSMSVNGREMEVVVRDHARMIDALIPRPEGGVWAMLYESPEIEDAAGRVCRFDEYDAAGNYTRALTLRGPVRLETARLFVRGDRAYVLHMDDEDGSGDVRLVCYALTTP